jgi:hypothetical protein
MTQPTTETPVAPRRVNRPLLWTLLLSTLVVTLFETALLDRKWGIFTGGFLQRTHLSGVQRPLFILLSLLLDAAVVVPLGYLTYQVVGRLRWLSGARRLFLVALVAACPLMLANFIKFQVARYLGDTIDFLWLTRLGGGSYKAMFGFISSYLVVVGVLVGATAAGIALMLWLLRWVPWGRDPSRLPVPGLARCSVHAGILAVLGLGVMFTTARTSPDLFRPLARKVTGMVAADATDRVLARAGAPLLRPDPARLYQPPQQFVDFSHEHAPPPRFAHRPDVIVFVIETFRYDNIGCAVDGKPVTPVMNRLIDQGAVFGKSYSPDAYTTGGINYALRGGVTLTDRTSLIDDFNANGYQTAAVSAMDDVFGNVMQDTGMDRLDYYHGAAEHADERSSAFAIAESLSVPWTVLTRNVDAFLAKHADPNRPLFLYTNVQDAHFPYHHYAMKPLVIDDPADRSDLTHANAERVRRTYRNSVANADMAVGMILEAVAKARGRMPAFIITGDHGESLFDPELLGHGIEMLEEQHATPLIVGGMPAECTFPMTHGEIRRMVRQALTRAPGAPTGRLDPDKRLFLHVGNLERPYAIGIASATGILSYQIAGDQLTAIGMPPADVDQNGIIERWRELVAYRRAYRERPATSQPALQVASVEDDAHTLEH